MRWEDLKERHRHQMHFVINYFMPMLLAMTLNGTLLEKCDHHQCTTNFVVQKLKRLFISILWLSILNTIKSIQEVDKIT